AHPLPQLLPRGQRTRRDSVAAERPRLLGNDPTIQDGGLHLQPACAPPGAHRRNAHGGAPMNTLDVVDRLDPALRHLGDSRTNLSADVLAGYRESLNRRRQAEAKALDTTGVSIEDTQACAVPVRIYRGAPSPAPAVIYCHSGAFVLGNLDID